MSQLVKFGDVVENLNLTASDTQLNRYERVVGLEHIIPNELKIQNWDLMANLHEGTSFRRIFKKGHVLFGKRRAYQRKVALADFDGICSSDILVFSAKKALLAGLLPYVVQSERFFDHANQTSSGSLSPRTRWQDLAKFTFQLPLLDEQARIVELMTAVDEHLDALRSQLEVAKGSRAAVLYQLLSAGGDDWVNTTLGDIAEVLSGFAFKSENFNENEGVPLIRIRDLQILTQTEVNYLGNYDNRYLVKDGDFLIGMDGEFRCYEWLGGTALLNQRVCRIQDFALVRVVPRFIFFIVNKYLMEIEGSTSFTTVKHISTKQVNEIEFPLPPIAEQKRIVEIVSSMDDVIQANEQAIAEAKVLRTTLLNKEIS